jgi:hypothetical protein
MAIIKLNMKKPECCRDCGYLDYRIFTDAYICDIRHYIFDDFTEYNLLSECYDHCPLEDEEDDNR